MEEAVEVSGGTTDYVAARTAEELSYYISTEDEVRLVCSMPYSLHAPVAKGDSVGAVTAYVNGVPVRTVELLADQECLPRDWLYYWKKLWNYFTYITVRP